MAQGPGGDSIASYSRRTVSRTTNVGTAAEISSSLETAKLIDENPGVGRGGVEVSRIPLDPPADALPTKWRIVEGLSIVLAALMLTLALIANGFASFGGSSIEMFGMQFTTSYLSGLYQTDITPPGPTFSTIWAIIYLWQIAWVAYACSYLCRPKAARTVKLGVYWMYSFTNACNIAWIYLFGNDFTEGALAFIILFFLSLLVTLGLAVYDTYSVRNAPALRKLHLWLTRVFVHNGLAFYTAWLSIAWLLNVAIVADQGQSGPLTTQDAGTLVLCILAGEILLWFALQHLLLHRFVGWIQVEYVVYIAALLSIVVDRWDKTEDRNRYFTLGLLIATVLLQVMRILLCILLWFCERRSMKRVVL